MKLRLGSAALVAIALGTSAWAEDSALHATNFVNCAEETFVAQLLESDQADNTQKASIAPDLTFHEVDPIAAIVDKIAQNTVLIGISSPRDESSAVASSIVSDLAEVTGSIGQVEFALEGLEDR
jgi:hypothetical protein